MTQTYTHPYEDRDTFNDAYAAWLNGKQFDIEQPWGWSLAELREHAHRLKTLREYRVKHHPKKNTAALDDETDHLMQFWKMAGLSFAIRARAEEGRIINEDEMKDLRSTLVKPWRVVKVFDDLTVYIVDNDNHYDTRRSLH